MSPTSSALIQRFSYLQQTPRSRDGEEKARRTMNMTADFGSSMLRRNSLLFWCTLVVPVAIIAIGINFILNPVGASAAFGVPIHDPAAFPFMWIKGIRDIFAGQAVLQFLWKGDRRTTATLFAISIFVPFGDGLVILRHLGFAPPIYIHWGTALYMMIVAAFLLRKENTMAGLS
jgi:Domain of unknown function (DUF4267)